MWIGKSAWPLRLGSAWMTGTIGSGQDIILSACKRHRISISWELMNTINNLYENYNFDVNIICTSK